MSNLLDKKAAEVMTKDPISVPPVTNMIEVKEIFRKNNFHHLPIINEENVCVGVISKTDYYHLLDKFSKFSDPNSDFRSDKFLSSLLAREVMTPHPAHVDSSEPLEEVVNLFLANRYHSVVVTEHGRCVGIITPYDILMLLKSS